MSRPRLGAALVTARTISRGSCLVEFTSRTNTYTGRNAQPIPMVSDARN